MTVSLKKIKYDVIFEALAGEIECGDQYFIKELDDFILLAVVDGLGHGVEAALAAKRAIQILDVHAHESVETLVGLCDQGLADTRGAAMTIVRIDANYKLTYMAIGNVMGVCWQMDENAALKQHSFFLEGGIVGARLPLSVPTKEIALTSGDTLILATDGIKNQFENEKPKLELPEDIAKKFFNTYRNKNDDALILVVRFL